MTMCRGAATLGELAVARTRTRGATETAILRFRQGCRRRVLVDASHDSYNTHVLQDYENIFGPAARDIKTDLQRNKRHARFVGML